MITEIICQNLVATAKKQIEELDNIAIITHLSPDGDAMGSSLAMYHFLSSLGKSNVNIVVPNAFPSFLSWLPEASDIVVFSEQTTQATHILLNAKLIIALDFNHLGRIGQMSEVIERSSAKKLLIDHHLYPSEFADIIISYPSISSTCELVFRLICRMGYFQHINSTIAECIYTGMMTDTGNFSYNSNNPEIYNIISELIKKGIDKDAIYNRVHNTTTIDRMRFMGYCLFHKMKIYPEYNTALIAISIEELRKFNYKAGDAEGFVNLPLSIDGIHFAVMMREDTDKIKISLRSQGSFPANKVAMELFNGGGHLNASGGESYQTLEETILKFEQALPNYFTSE